MKSHIALGAMNFGGRTPEPESLRMIARAIERGVELIDTANVYGDGASEKIVGRAKPTVRIASKVGIKRVNGKREGLSPDRMRVALRETLDNLQMSSIDIWYLHAPDDSVPLKETLSAIKEAIDGGLVKSWGMSNYASWEMLEAIHITRSLEMPPPVIAQVIYNLLIRQLDIEWFKFAGKYGIHTTVYNALAGGLLSGRHRLDDKPEKGSRFDKNKMYVDRYWTERNFALVDRYRGVAERAGMDLPTLAHAWIAGRRGVDSVLIGPATLPQLDAAIDACEKTLTDETRAELDRIHVEAMGTDARYAR
jgi:aryl-alcohol dehydrogenase-like predicted oxidoreductase